MNEKELEINDIKSRKNEEIEELLIKIASLESITDEKLKNLEELVISIKKEYDLDVDDH